MTSSAITEMLYDDFSIISSYAARRLFGVSFFESSILFLNLKSPMMTAAATKGPAKGPTPDSSTPAMTLCPLALAFFS